jgi:MYXO-CTERM domain-containing protein
MPAGVKYKYFFEPKINDAGTITFSATLVGPGITPSNEQVLYVGQPNALSLVARTGGTDAPGAPPGVKFNSFFVPAALDSSGSIAFFGGLAGPGVNGTNDSGLWAGSPSQPSLVMRQGDQAPGAPAGYVFNNAADVLLNDNGGMVFSASLNFNNNGAGVGIWTRDASGLHSLAITGNHAPGTAFDFSGFHALAMSPDGEIVAFLASINAPASPSGVWIADDIGQLRKLILEGDTVDIDGVGPRVVSSFAFYGDFGRTILGEPTDPNLSLNDLGQVFLRATFTDGSSGVFTAEFVPEPALLAWLALVPLAARRRRRKPRCLSSPRENQLRTGLPRG